MMFDSKTHCYCASCKTTHKKPRPKTVNNQSRNVTIIDLYTQGFSQVQIGIKFCLTKQAVSKIIKQYKKETIKQ